MNFELKGKTQSRLRGFTRDTRGNIALMFGLSAVPLLLFAGASLDYSRAAGERIKLQAALDSIALSLAHEPVNTPYSVMHRKAERLFAANYKDSRGAVPSFSLSISRPRLSISATSKIPTTLMALAGQRHMEVGGKSQVLFGNAKLEIALALDNTGSMNDNGKIGALKSAVNNLITTVERATRYPGDSKMAIVPFNTQVNIGAAYSAAPWLRWDVTLENPNFHGASPIPPAPASWTGCISDREQAYDVTSDPVSVPASKYPAEVCEFPGLATTRALTTGLETIRAEANAMQPGGATNVTIGLTTAMAMLRADNPLGANAQTGPDILKYVVLLTDGKNTENRFVGNGSDGNPDAPAIDDRLRQACLQAKTQPVQIFTIRVMDGDEALLRDCASTPKNYFNVTDASQLSAVFDQIAGQIAYSRIRLTK